MTALGVQKLPKAKAGCVALGGSEYPETQEAFEERIEDRKGVEMKPEDLITKLDVRPFTRVVWNSVMAQDEWSPVFQRAQRLHDRLEYEMVKQGLRPCATMHLSPRNYDEAIERIMHDRLVWLPIQRTQSYGGFSHKHFPVKQLDMNSSVYGVLARKKEDAEAFRAASKHTDKHPTDHKTIGELLGFPECCTEYFRRVWPTFYDPVYQTALASPHKVWVGENYQALQVRPHIATQQMLRYAGLRLTSHFPCSLDCQASIEVGQKWYDLAKSVDPQGLDAFLKVMELPGEWSACHGIAVVETDPFTVVTNSLPTKKKWVVRWDRVDTYERRQGQE